jgi:hypothetical protein
MQPDTEKPRQPEVFTEPMRAEVNGSVIVIFGPGSDAVAITAEAAEESARRIMQAVQSLRT